jgi:AcrR family transcriptional regulator
MSTGMSGAVTRRLDGRAAWSDDEGGLMRTDEGPAATLPRRTTLLDAAIAILADGGSRALTHRAVDRRLGLSLGSTANYFTTRDALLLAVGERLVELDLAAIAPITEGPVGASIAADLIAEQLIAWLGPQIRKRQVAHLELVLQSSRDPRLRTAVAKARGDFVHATAQALAATGCRAPMEHAPGLVALFDGLYIDQLLYAKVPADKTSLRGHVERFLIGC